MSKKGKKHKNAREELEILYGAKCMLTDYKNDLTFHHIKKKEHGGNESVENGAALCRLAHSYLHILENKNKKVYEELNEALRLYKICVQENETECLEEFELVKEQVRKLIKDKK